MPLLGKGSIHVRLSKILVSFGMDLGPLPGQGRKACRPAGVRLAPTASRPSVSVRGCDLALLAFLCKACRGIPTEILKPVRPRHLRAISSLSSTEVCVPRPFIPIHDVCVLVVDLRELG